jgi:hypothetical protein
LDAHPDFAVSEPPDLHLGERDIELSRDGFAEVWVGVAAEDAKII